MKKKIKEIIATVSVLVFIVSVAVYIISAFIGFYYSDLYSNMIWSGFSAVVSFVIMLIIAGTPDNESYRKYLNRRRRRR